MAITLARLALETNDASGSAGPGCCPFDHHFLIHPFLLFPISFVLHSSHPVIPFLLSFLPSFLPSLPPPRLTTLFLLLKFFKFVSYYLALPSNSFFFWSLPNPPSSHKVNDGSQQVWHHRAPGSDPHCRLLHAHCAGHGQREQGTLRGNALCPLPFFFFFI